MGQCCTATADADEPQQAEDTAAAPLKPLLKSRPEAIYASWKFVGRSSTSSVPPQNNPPLGGGSSKETSDNSDRSRHLESGEDAMLSLPALPNDNRHPNYVPGSNDSHMHTLASPPPRCPAPLPAIEALQHHNRANMTSKHDDDETRLSPAEVLVSNPLSFPNYHSLSSVHRSTDAVGNCLPQYGIEGTEQSPTHSGAAAHTWRSSHNKSAQSILSSIGGSLQLVDGFGIGSHPIGLPVVFAPHERRLLLHVCHERSQQSDDPRSGSPQQAQQAQIPSTEGTVAGTAPAKSDSKSTLTTTDSSDSVAYLRNGYSHDADDSADLFHQPNGSGWWRDKPAVVLGTQGANYGVTFRHLEFQCKVHRLSQTPEASDATSSSFSVRAFAGTSLLLAEPQSHHHHHIR